ncbi:MAG: hypothetical protein ACYC0F_06150 [Rhodanobacter sp.]
MRSVVACALLLAWAAMAPAAELPDVKIEAVVQGGAGARDGGVAAETVWIKGERVRVDFDAGKGRRGRILRGGGHAWLLMSTSSRALPADHVRIGAITRLDPQRPCWDLGFACSPAENRRVAGRLANGWRYRHAGRDGPGGTDNGVFWIDAQYGLLLAFQAQDLGLKPHRMEATAVHFAKLSDDAFALPESIRMDVKKADSRARALRGYGH